MIHHLQKRRVRLDLTQTYVGKLVGVSPSVVSSAERAPHERASLKWSPVIDKALARLEAANGLPPLRFRDYRIFERRTALKLTRRQLAELSGFSCDWRGETLVAEVEVGRSTPSELRDVRRALIWEETKERRKREHRRSEDARVARAEALWNAVPESPAKAALLAAMLDRCVELMHDNEGEACDAIADWLPKPAVEAMFDRWWNESLADRKCCACSPEDIR